MTKLHSLTPLVLLPGMMCDARLYGPQIDALAARRWLSLPCITDHETVGALAAEVLKNAPPVFALAGLSMGGIVAMEVARQAPERIERLALLDTNPLADLEKVSEGRLVNVARVERGDLAEVMRDSHIPNYLPGGEITGPVPELCADMAQAIGPKAYIRQSRALMARPDQQQTLAAFSGPTLILTGAHDRLCPMGHHTLMHSLIPNSRLAIIDGAGHLPTLEKPEETTAELLRWLEE